MDGLSRRSVVRTAAWSAPVVVVAAAAPAFATSTSSLVANYGSTGITNPGGYWYVNAANLSVTSSSAIAANDLKLTSLYSDPAFSQYANGATTPWILTTGNPSNPAVWSYPLAVAAGETISFPNGLFLAVEQSSAGTYTLSFSTSMTVSQSLILTTSSGAAAARGSQRRPDPFA